VIVCPGPDWFLLIASPALIVSTVSRSPLSNHLRLPVYVNPVCIIPQCGVVPFGSCLSSCVTCNPELNIGLEELSALGSSLALAATTHDRLDIIRQINSARNMKMFNLQIHLQ